MRVDWERHDITMWKPWFYVVKPRVLQPETKGYTTWNQGFRKWKVSIKKVESKRPRFWKNYYIFKQYFVNKCKTQKTSPFCINIHFNMYYMLFQPFASILHITRVTYIMPHFTSFLHFSKANSTKKRLLEKISNIYLHIIKKIIYICNY